MFKQKLAAILTSSLLTVTFSSTAGFAADIREYQNRTMKAAQVLESVTTESNNRIPESLLRRADAVAVIPNIKGTFGTDATYGRGLVSERLDDGRWSAPSFMTIQNENSGGSPGASTDLILVFTDKRALSSLINGTGVKLGTDVGVVPGPIGPDVQTGVVPNAKAEIFSYSRSNGLLAGVGLDGEVINIDQTANQRVYGLQTSTADILNSSTLASNPNVSTFVDTLKRTISTVPTTF